MTLLGKIDWTGRGSAQARTAMTIPSTAKRMFPCVQCGNPTPSYTVSAAACDDCKAKWRADVPRRQPEPEVSLDDIPF